MHATTERQFQQQTSLTLDAIHVPPEAEEGHLFETTATVTNHSGSPLAFTLTWLVDGSVAGVEEIDGPFAIQPGATQNYTIELGPMAEGASEVCAELSSNAIGPPLVRCDTIGPDEEESWENIPVFGLVVVLVILAAAIYAQRTGAHKQFLPFD